MKAARGVVALVAVVVACGEPTAPTLSDPTSVAAMLAAPAPTGAWKFEGAASHYAVISATFTRRLAHDTLYLEGEATASLLCTGGAATYSLAVVTLAGAPNGSISVPCQLTGTFFGRQTSVSTIEGYVAWREAPMSAGLKGTLDANTTTFTATLESRANVNPAVMVNGVAFNRQP